MTGTAEKADLAAGFRRVRPVVRAWLERDLGGGALDSTAAYADLMFAYGLARVGATTDANGLVRAASVVLLADDAFAGTPENEIRNNATWERWVGANVRRCLAGAFRFRVEEAVAGTTSAATLPESLLYRSDHSRAANTPGLRVEYVTQTVRRFSRILEPHDFVDQYAFHTGRSTDLRGRIALLTQTPNTPDLEARIAALLAEAEFVEPGGRAAAWRNLVALSGLTGEAYRSALLLRVPTVVADVLATLPTDGRGTAIWDRLRCTRELLCNAVHQAAAMPAGEFFPPLVDAVEAVVRAVPAFAAALRPRDGLTLEATAAVALAELGWACLCWFSRLGGREEADAFLFRTRDLWPAAHRDDPAAVRAIAIHAGLLGLLGRREEATGRLNTAAECLARVGRGERTMWTPTDTTDVMIAYARGAGAGDVGEAIERVASALPALRTLTNTFTTAQYFSRFHLQVVEGVVLAFPQVRG